MSKGLADGAAASLGGPPSQNIFILKFEIHTEEIDCPLHGMPRLDNTRPHDGFQNMEHGSSVHGSVTVRCFQE